MGARNRVGIGFLYRPARQHRLESIPWNRFLCSLNVYKFGLCCYSTSTLNHPTSYFQPLEFCICTVIHSKKLIQKSKCLKRSLIKDCAAKVCLGQLWASLTSKSASWVELYCRFWFWFWVNTYRGPMYWLLYWKPYKRDFFVGFYVLYSTLLHFPPLRFHCVRDAGIEPRTVGIDNQTFLNLGYRSHNWNPAPLPLPRPPPRYCLVVHIFNNKNMCETGRVAQCRWNQSHTILD